MASPLDYLMGLGETGATLGTGAISGLLGMPYGLYKGVTSGKYGTPQGVKIAEQEAANFMARNTYQPRTAQGQQNLQQLAGLLESSKLPPVIPEAALLGQIPRQAYAAQAERAGMAAERALEPVVQRTMQRGGKGAQLLQDLAQGSMSPMDVWHGSPYGPFKKFDPSKARTGEGNATFGEGAYLAQARGTGETYRDVLSAGKQAESLLSSDKMSDKIAANTLQMYKTPSKAIDVLQSSLTPNLTDEARQATNDAIDALKNINKNAGFLYKVDLPDEQIAKMLDYDKPLSQQAPEVQAALAELGISVDKKKLGEFHDALLDALENPNSTTTVDQLPKAPRDWRGEQILKMIELNPSQYFPKVMEGRDLTSAMINPRVGVSDLLGRKGITGVRYLDQMSRDAGEGTSNFVVFPQYQDLLTIKEINDQPVGGLLAP